MLKIKAILFDLDGTLIDSAQDIFIAQQYALQKTCHLEVSHEELCKLKGLSLRHVLAFFKKSPVEDLNTKEYNLFKKRYGEHYEINLFNHTHPFPHVIKTLCSLDKFIKTIATTKPLAYAKALLHHFNMESYFKIIMGSEGLPLKPDPSIFLETIKKLRMKAGECLVVGDTEMDIQAGSRAGCITCRIQYHPKDKIEGIWKSDYIIRDFRDLRKILGMAKKDKNN